MSMGLPLILSTTLAAAAPACSWAHPGANPFRGDPARALADFDLPRATQRLLRALMAAHRPTDVVTITRDGIAGEHGYADMREMHSGGGRVCRGSVGSIACARRPGVASPAMVNDAIRATINAARRAKRSRRAA